MIVYNKTTLGIFAIVATLGILTTSTALTLQPAHALSKFFNCTTDVANKTHNLTLEDVNACYNKEFHTSGGPGTETTPTTIPTTTHITTTESGEHRGSSHHQDAIRTSIHSPSSSFEGYHRAHNEGFSSTTTTTESGEHRGSLHHRHGTTITSIHSPSSSFEGYHRAHNEGFSSSSTAAAAAASIDELLRGYSGVHSSSSSVIGDAAASSSSSSGGASASASATAR
jgi:hypothetical protein